ncbi:uncharacterized protein LOC126844981 [Adelges cooleyi]|uniref:uncharacterized protein LOC126844981 n=1 Tax=Adelges cooleyi TaxID=133065 RepID=UPI002180780D|nr:uncharacterized protein LOC126844981 [Adelges cooleyi]
MSTMEENEVLDFNYTLKYTLLLNKLNADNKLLAALKISAASKQEISQIDQEKQCPYCLISWTEGQFTIKTIPCSLNVKKKNKKPPKVVSLQRLFKMVAKCTVCHNTTNLVFNKNKLPKENRRFKNNKKEEVNLNPTKNSIDTIKKTKKKKKKKPYAGLNPLVFKNPNYCKKK